MTLFDLTGHAAIVTGSSRGIGKAIAEAIVAQGGSVVISSRTKEACDAVADELNGRREGSAVSIPANISSKSDLERLVSGARDAFGEIDSLICNAASNPYYGPMTGISDEQFQKILANNVLSNHWLIQLCAPGMTERGKGSIVIVSSIGGLKASTTIGAYNVSKAADFQLARNYAAELGPKGVRTNCIAPGLIKTDFAKALWDDAKAKAAFERSHPLRRMGEPEDIAGAAVFLASDASAYVNGQTIVVDGGSTIQ